MAAVKGLFDVTMVQAQRRQFVAEVQGRLRHHGNHELAASLSVAVIEGDPLRLLHLAKLLEELGEEAYYISGCYRWHLTLVPGATMLNGRSLTAFLAKKYPLHAVVDKTPRRGRKRRPRRSKPAPKNPVVCHGSESGGGDPLDQHLDH